MVIIKRTSLYFLSSFIGGILFLLVTPFATKILNPEDYGIYALGLAFGNIISAVATNSIGYTLQSFLNEKKQQDREVISSCLLFGSIIAVACSVIMIACYFIIPTIFELVHLNLLLIIIFAAILETPWVISIEIQTLQGNAVGFASLQIIRAVVAATSLLICLYWLNMTGISLFISYASASLVVCIMTLYQLRHNLHWPRKMEWFKEIITTFPHMIFYSAGNSLSILVERNLLSRFASLHQLGIYNHAQIHNNYIGTALKSVLRSIWPISLKEAKEQNSKFLTTGAFTNIMHTGLTIAGIFFCFLGREFIGLLTNNKFVDATPYVIGLIIVTMLQFCSKAHSTMLIAFKYNRLTARLNLLSQFIYFPLLLVLIPTLSVWGAIIAIGGMHLFLRLSSVFYAMRIKSVPFQDIRAILGIALIAASYLATSMYVISLPVSMFIFILSSGLLALSVRKDINMLLSYRG